MSASQGASQGASQWLLNRQQAAAIAEDSRQKRAAEAAREASKRAKRPTSSADRAAAKEAMLAQYPCIPLSEYAPDGHHLAINVDFPGLRAIHKEPWIFLVSDLLTGEECERMMAKALPHFEPSGSYSNGHRTSSECRIARSETRGIQSRYSKLLNMPVESMEAAKVSRYRTGEYFRNHVDPLSSTEFLENRIATLFVYDRAASMRHPVHAHPLSCDSARAQHILLVCIRSRARA